MAAEKSTKPTNSLSMTKLFGLAFVIAGAVFGLINFMIIAIHGDTTVISAVTSGCTLVGAILMLITVVREG